MTKKLTKKQLLEKQCSLMKETQKISYRIAGTKKELEAIVVPSAVGMNVYHNVYGTGRVEKDYGLTWKVEFTQAYKLLDVNTLYEQEYICTESEELDENIKYRLSVTRELKQLKLKHVVIKVELAKLQNLLSGKRKHYAQICA